jgi:hypothetical protein
MSKVPKHTTKRPKKELRQKVQERAMRPDFEGAPIWNDWLVEQYEAKKREVGLLRRIARTAISGFAGAVIVAEMASIMPAAIAEAHHKQRANKLQPAKSQKQEMAGRQSRQKAKEAGRKVDAWENRSAGRLGSWALGHRERIQRKRRDTYQRRLKEFEMAKEVSWKKHVDQTPELKERLIAEQKQNDRQYEINETNNRYQEMQTRGQFVAEQLVVQKPDSIAAALPQRPDLLPKGSYSAFAKLTRMRAAKHRQEDGSISLFSRAAMGEYVLSNVNLTPKDAEYSPEAIDVIVSSKRPIEEGATNWDYVNHKWAAHTQKSNFTSAGFRSSNNQLEAKIGYGHDYVGGVATSLWKMGFVEFDTHDGVVADSGRMNEAVEWSQGENGATFASLAYDPENELHRIIAGDQADPSNSRIQLAINDTQGYAPEMSISLTEQPVLVHVA